MAINKPFTHITIKCQDMVFREITSKIERKGQILSTLIAVAHRHRLENAKVTFVVPPCVSALKFTFYDYERSATPIRHGTQEKHVIAQIWVHMKRYSRSR